MTDIILATESATRIRLLEHVGVAFRAEASGVDERAIEDRLVEAGHVGVEISLALAEAKAAAVAERHGDALVIGADQTMEHDGHCDHKPGSREEAAAQLASLAGKVHWLHTAVALVADGRETWHHTATARLAMRPLTAGDIEAYLDEVGDRALASVGAYQIEGPGLKLFDDIHGDYFAILGLPMLPLLKALRQAGAAL